MAQTKSEGHRSCGIAEGTMVLTKKGYLPIEKIKVGPELFNEAHS